MVDRGAHDTIAKALGESNVATLDFFGDTPTLFEQHILAAARGFTKLKGLTLKLWPDEDTVSAFFEENRNTLEH